MDGMFSNVTLSTINYSNMLLDWSALSLQSGVNFNAGNSKYYTGTPATARGVLTSTYSWNISDGGSTVPPTFNDTADGNWNSGTTWGNAGSVEGTDYPGPYDTAIINSNTVTLSANQTVSTTTVSSSGILNLAGYQFSVSPFTVSSTLKLTGDETAVGGGALTTPTLTDSTVEYIATSGTRNIKGWTYNNLGINGSGGTFTVGTTDLTIPGTLTISSGIFSAPSGNLSIAGNWSNSGTFNANSGTITFNGTSAISGTTTNTFNNVSITGALTATSSNMNIAGNWSNSGTFNANSGTITFNGTSAISGTTTNTFNNVSITGALTATSSNMNIAGNWSNSGTFNANSGTITFNGANQTLFGDTTFYNLTKSTSTADTLTFAANSTQSIASGGILTLSGATSNLLSLRSNSTPTKWNLNVDHSATIAVDYVDVMDSDASSGNIIAQTNSTSSGNNLNWFFDITSPSISLTALTPDPNSDNTPTLSGTAIDASSTITNVEFQMDGTSGSWTSCTPTDETFNSENEAFSCTPSTLADGSHTIYVRSTDSIGNTTINASASTDTFVIDTVSPTVDAGTDKIKNAIFTQNATTTDATSGVSSWLWSKVSGTGTITFGSATSKDTTVSANTDGTYVIKLTATDGAGNSASSTFSLIWDTEAPTNSISSPSSSVTNSGPITYTITYGGADSVTLADGNITLNTSNTATGTAVVSGSGTTTRTVTITSITGDGTIGISIDAGTAYDTVGNSSLTAGPSTTFTVDNTTPTISNISPINGASVSATGQIITYSLNEIGDCRLSTSLKSYSDMSGDTICSTSNGVQISCTAPSLGSSGTKDVYLACQDSIGNKDSTSTATHMSYVISSVRRPNNSGSSSSVPANQYSILINNGANSTDNRLATINFSKSVGSDATAVVLSNNPDFLGASIISYQASSSFDICQGSDTCPDSNYTIYAKFLNPYGVAYPIVFSQISLNAIPLITEITNITTEVVSTIASTTSEIITAILPPPEKPMVVFPPIETSVPEVSQYVFSGEWEVPISSLLNNFVFASLPSDFRNTIQKFPDITNILAKIGIARMTDIGALATAKISLPNLSESIGLIGENIAISELSQSQINKIPTNFVFVRALNQKIDLNVKFSVSNNGLTSKTINTVQGNMLSFVIRPEQSAKKVEGYLIFKSNNTNEVGTDKFVPKLAQTAAVLNAFDTQDTVNSINNSSLNNSPDLVLNKFEYKETADGLWTADVFSPQVLGQYELRTVVSYKEETKVQEKISMIVVVDPEGYVFEKLRDGREIRLYNASVSLYWQNPETKKYEPWKAGDFRQQNPQTTDITGRYSFLVPVGMYYLKAHLDSYSDYQSEPFQVDESKGVFMNIELKANLAWLKLFNLQTILTAGIFMVLAYFAVIFTVRRGKKDDEIFEGLNNL